MEEEIKQVRKVLRSGNQRIITIAKQSSIQVGDYVVVKKLNLEEDKKES